MGLILRTQLGVVLLSQRQFGWRMMYDQRFWGMAWKASVSVSQPGVSLRGHVACVATWLVYGCMESAAQVPLTAASSAIRQALQASQIGRCMISQVPAVDDHLWQA
jgi:hypothetical protein